ncbi:hypothetical protein RZS08_37615, partial [Arthrospira platensis SPKY1]|nr:hypothetical protein [Arthrospira platensis SPKY1]
MASKQSAALSAAARQYIFFIAILFCVVLVFAPRLLLPGTIRLHIAKKPSFCYILAGIFGAKARQASFLARKTKILHYLWPHQL